VRSNTERPARIVVFKGSKGRSMHCGWWRGVALLVVVVVVATESSYHEAR
jgi:hypothetical protein